jgi:hypothetical protein
MRYFLASDEQPAEREASWPDRFRHVWPIRRIPMTRMAAEPKPSQPALPEPRTNLDFEYEMLMETVFNQERLARRWGWLNGGSGASRHTCSPPDHLAVGWGTRIVNGLPVWRCPGCGQTWTQTLSGPWTTTIDPS